MSALWSRVATRWLPFADAASAELPLGRLLRLSLFQLSCGMAAVLLTGTLNRVMIVELGLPAGGVAALVALPLLFAPARALIGFRSDHHRSVLGWRRAPYIWFGTLLQFGGLAILPFALLVMTGEGHGPAIIGQLGAALGFLLVGAGLHTTQTAGLALATDIAPARDRPRVVALLYVMLLGGMLAASVVMGQLLLDFTPTRLVGVIQGAALVTLALNLVALWKQEPRRPTLATATPRPDFAESWRRFLAPGRTRRLLVAIALGAAGFQMQDVLLEPYGGEVMGLGVGATTQLTAIWALGTLVALAFAARQLACDADPLRLAGLGVTIGILAFAFLVLAAPLDALPLFLAGTLLVGFGGGLFAVGTLVAAMGLRDGEGAGLALGAWGAVQATAAGVGILLAGLARDGVGAAAISGALGPGLASPATGYGFVYHLEIGLLFATLVALGPLARRLPDTPDGSARPFGLAAFPA
jgi:BCD family chlorophyll transporter-like MFS transporter